jgi:hypothetical protein
MSTSPFAMPVALVDPDVRRRARDVIGRQPPPTACAGTRSHRARGATSAGVRHARYRASVRRPASVRAYMTSS